MACINFEISINYGFQMEKNTEISAFSFESKHLLLCIFSDNSCISSLSITYENRKLIFESRTKKEHEGNKLNKLLIAVVIIIAKQLYPDAVCVFAAAINPISSYLMIKYFNAKICDEYANEISTDVLNTYTEHERYIESNGGMYTKVDLTLDNEKTAMDVFNKIVTEKTWCMSTKKPTIGGKIRSCKAKIIKKRTIKKYKNTRIKKYKNKKIRKSKKNDMIQSLSYIGK
jgi:hypothetical protein